MRDTKHHIISGKKAVIDERFHGMLVASHIPRARTWNKVLIANLHRVSSRMAHGQYETISRPGRGKQNVDCFLWQPWSDQPLSYRDYKRLVARGNLIWSDWRDRRQRIVTRRSESSVRNHLVHTIAMALEFVRSEPLSKGAARVSVRVTSHADCNQVVDFVAATRASFDDVMDLQHCRSEPTTDTAVAATPEKDLGANAIKLRRKPL